MAKVMNQGSKKIFLIHFFFVIYIVKFIMIIDLR
jgi:hypothetical protein